MRFTTKSPFTGELNHFHGEVPHSLCEDVCGSIENMRWFWGQGPKTIVQVPTTENKYPLWGVGLIPVQWGNNY